jgi:hypothetical protein
MQLASIRVKPVSETPGKTHLSTVMEDPEVEQVTLARPVSMMQVALSESKVQQVGQEQTPESQKWEHPPLAPS